MPEMTPKAREVSGRKSFSSIEEALCYYTECQFATLEGLKLVKQTPKHELARHESIAFNMAEQCRAFCHPKHLTAVGAGRVREHLGWGE